LRARSQVIYDVKSLWPPVYEEEKIAGNSRDIMDVVSKDTAKIRECFIRPNVKLNLEEDILRDHFYADTVRWGGSIFENLPYP
jgi:hypothetical protein